MRLVVACVVGWFVVAAGAALASRPSDDLLPTKGRHDRSGSLIVALGSPEAR